MTTPPVVSPPPALDASATSQTATEIETENPISPTATNAPPRPLIEISVPAINAQPVELDSVDTGTSPEALLRRRETGEGSGNHVGGVISPGLGEEEDTQAEFLAEGGEGGGHGVAKGVARELREKRAAILASRSKDPGVIVDVPKEPTAEEVQAVGSADGSVTPALRGE